MIALITVLMLQAAPPAEPAPPTQMAAETPAAAPAPAPAEAATPEPTEPKMKKVCRKVMDPRVGTLGSRRTECKYVQLD